jgi:hypothetical protein
MRLQIDPELGRRAKVPGEQEGRVGRDGPAAAVVHSGAGHLDRVGERVNADAHRLEEILTQDLAGMGQWNALSRRHLLGIDAPRVQRLTPNGHGIIYDSRHAASAEERDRDLGLIGTSKTIPV